MKLIFILLILLCIYYIYIQYKEHFIPVDALTNHSVMKDNINLFDKVNNILRKNNIEYWIIGGALIGTMRNSYMVTWDDDIDIAIMDHMSINLENLEPELNKNNLVLHKFWFGYKIYEKTGKNIPNNDFKYPFIDIFIYMKDNNILIFKDEVARKEWAQEYFNITDVFPLKEYNFEHIKVLGPNNPYDFLDRVYSDWKNVGKKLNFNHITHTDTDSSEFEIYHNNGKPFIWLYWDNINGNATPGFIELCRETVYKNCSTNFNIVLLNKDNIIDWLPDIKNYMQYIDKLIIAHKVDIYRIMLLYKYGGIYLDSDIIVMRDLSDIIEQLKKYDFVGFGCTGMICKYGYSKPSNWFLASRPHTKLMGTILDKQIAKLTSGNKIEYHDIGKILIWDSLNEMINKENYEYYHYSNIYDGTRDIEGHWITSDIVFSNTPIKYDNDNEFIFYVFYNSEMDSNIKKMSKEQLLAKDWNFTKYLKRGLKL